jgi:hypothetical protein
MPGVATFAVVARRRRLGVNWRRASPQVQLGQVSDFDVYGIREISLVSSRVTKHLGIEKGSLTPSSWFKTGRLKGSDYKGHVL